ncbi:hypothetical protein NFI96_028699 [Prochilodus magdalenae]|nr:hypothetical protein NFI96_028699 [Prochilodus magdalenae]
MEDLHTFLDLVGVARLLSQSFSNFACAMTRRTVYSRDQVLALRKTPPLFTSRPEIPAELRRPYRGCRAGNKRWERKRRYKPCLPSIIMGNVRSLANKTDELSALIRTQREYRECSILCFTESWLNQNVPDSHLHLNGFTTVRADRVYHQTGKKRGGGLAVFDRWCNPGHITVKEVICQPDIELTSPWSKDSQHPGGSVRKRSPEAVESLQGCFEATQWDVLCDPHNQIVTIDEVTSCVTDYINFCVDSVVPSKTIRCFANNKPWVTSNLKHLLNQKKRGSLQDRG